MQATENAKVIGQIRAAIEEQRQAEAVQTALGTYERAVVLPLSEVAILIDEVIGKQEAVGLLALIDVLSAVLVEAQRSGTILPLEVIRASNSLQAAALSYRETKGGPVLQSLIDSKRSEVVEDIGELLEATANGDQGRADWQKGKLREGLRDLRQMTARQLGGEVEGWWQSAEELIEALDEGQEAMVEWHRGNLQSALGAAVVDEAVLTS